MEITWKGVYPAVTTKFKEDLSLDIEGFQRNIQAQLDAGVKGIILGGTLGEASVLNGKEKSALVHATREVVEGQLPVILNIAEQTTEAAKEVSRSAESDGANGLMMLPPMRYFADDLETVAYFKEVANNTSLPIMIYNNPVDYKKEVTLDMFDQLIACENIQAVKESTRDVTNVTRMINRFGDRLSILSGVDTLAVESMVMGANGWVAGLVCAFPNETVAIYELIQAGRIKEAVEIFRWFLPLLELDINPKLVQNIKLAEEIVGLGTEIVRPPRKPLYGKEREAVLNIINESIATRPELPMNQPIEL